MRKQLVVGNWKMHGNHSANAELLAGIVAARPFVADVAHVAPTLVSEASRSAR